MITAAIARSELRYRRLFEAARDGILIVDPQTRHIVDVNPFLEEFLGYPYEYFIGKELFEIGVLKDEEASRVAFHELQTNGYIRYDDLPLQTKTGRRVEVEFVSNLYHEGDETIIQCNVRDISARKKVEGALRAADAKLSKYAAELEDVVRLRTTELQRSNEQLETFVYSIAHDLRAPIRAMHGFAQLLIQEHTAHLSDGGRKYTGYIKTAAETMDHLVVDLLAFSHISQQKMDLQPVDLKRIVENAVACCATEISQCGAHIENISTWPAVMGHPATLQQVLVNLVGNAVKFVGPRPPRVRLYAEERPGEIVRICVEDNGIGIAPEFQTSIFQVFKRLHTSYAGTGIGLAIVEKGVERMGGHVGVISTPGEGSTFWIELLKPLRPEPSPGQRGKESDKSGEWI